MTSLGVGLNLIIEGLSVAKPMILGVTGGDFNTSAGIRSVGGHGNGSLLARDEKTIYINIKIHKETHVVNRLGSKLRDFEGLWTDRG